MELTISVSNIKPVEEMVAVLTDILKDERIPENIRLEYRRRIESIVWEE